MSHAEEIGNFAKEQIARLGEHARKCIEPRDQRIAELERDLAELKRQLAERGEAVGYFNGEFGGDVNGRMWFKVNAHDAIPAAGAKLYTGPQAPEGWQLVPVEPTYDVIEAIAKASTNCAWPSDFGETAIKIRRRNARNAYAAMLAAAPGVKP